MARNFKLFSQSLNWLKIRIIIFQLKIPLDLNSHLVSYLDAISIPVAKPFILPGKIVKIYSWALSSYIDLPRRHIIQEMEVVLETEDICDKRINPKNHKSYIRRRQMCGRPLHPNQRITMVIKLIFYQLVGICFSII